MLRVAATGIATFLTVIFVPESVDDVGALFKPALFMTLGLIIPIALQFRGDSRVLLRAENILMVGLIYWLLLDPLQSAYSFAAVESRDLVAAFVALGCFAASIWIGASGTGFGLPLTVKKAASQSIGVRALFGAAIVSFILGILKFALAAGIDPAAMIAGLQADRWSAPWARGQSGGWDAFADHLSYFGYILPSLCVLIANKTGWRDRRVITAVLLTFIMLLFLAQGGSRRIIGVVVGAGIVTWLLTQTRLKLTRLLGAVIAIATLLIVMQEMLRYRGVGMGEWVAGNKPDLHVTHLHVDDNFLRLAQLIMFFPSSQPYVWHGPIVHALTLPIPRALWPGKPDGPGFDLPALVGVDGTSLSCSIIGELYVSFGFAAVILGGLLMGRLAGMWNRILYLPHGDAQPLLYGLGVMAMFGGLRSMQALVQMSYMILAWLAISALIKRKARLA